MINAKVKSCLEKSKVIFYYYQSVYMINKKKNLLAMSLNQKLNGNKNTKINGLLLIDKINLLLNVTNLLIIYA